MSALITHVDAKIKHLQDLRDGATSLVEYGDWDKRDYHKGKAAAYELSVLILEDLRDSLKKEVQYGG